MIAKIMFARIHKILRGMTIITSQPEIPPQRTRIEGERLEMYPLKKSDTLTLAKHILSFLFRNPTRSACRGTTENNDKPGCSSHKILLKIS